MKLSIKLKSLTEFDEVIAYVVLENASSDINLSAFIGDNTDAVLQEASESAKKHREFLHIN